ncbi:MAG: antibiotic biosynthesis monooxygenase [Prevotella sp.]|nr:antibiotic biosynthesis monooxygenase [Prevotella sp.]
MLVRIAEVEIHPQYVADYLSAAREIERASLAEEPGVVCLFPNQAGEDSTQIRILEIYASPEAYQHHLQTAHFQRYKQGTLHMVKALKLQDLKPLDAPSMRKIFQRMDLWRGE